MVENFTVPATSHDLENFFATSHAFIGFATSDTGDATNDTGDAAMKPPPSSNPECSSCSNPACGYCEDSKGKLCEEPKPKGKKYSKVAPKKDSDDVDDKKNDSKAAPNKFKALVAAKKVKAT